MTVTRHARHLPYRLVILACGLLLISACGSGGGTSADASAVASATAGESATSPPASPVPDTVVCADAAALRASLDRLTGIAPAAGAADQIRSALREVGSNLETLVADARGRWQPQTSALRSALDALGTAVDNLAATPSRTALSDLSSALEQVDTAARGLVAALEVDCPSASPSASG